jgi:hypothetical protein
MIVGILKVNSDKIEEYVSKGYSVVYINDHVKKVGESLLKKELSEDEIADVRMRGNKVSSRYWVNLALMSVRESNRNNCKIAVADLQEEDNKSIFSKVV